MATALSAVSMDAFAAAEVSARVSRFARFLSLLMLVGIEIVALPCRLLFARRD
jgi:hypothetical protein